MVNFGKKKEVKDHWEGETCGTRFSTAQSRKVFFDEISYNRYANEPYIKEFAGFNDSTNRKILEIGVGAGSDFINWVENGAIATGIDLTKSAIVLTKERLKLFGHDEGYILQCDDAENLSFKDHSFDWVYSWGVLHHSPKTEQTLREVYRVLSPDGTAKIMVYGTRSWTGLMLWFRFAFLKGKFGLTEKEVISQHLESAGTKIYSHEEFRLLMEKVGFKDVKIQRKLGTGDLLLMPPSKKFESNIYKIIWKLYPRFIVKALGHRFGLFLMCEAKK